MKTRITWEQHGDLLVMKANGWIRAVIYYEGGWWTAGTFEDVGTVGLAFHRRKRDAKRDAMRDYQFSFHGSDNKRVAA